MATEVGQQVDDERIDREAMKKLSLMGEPHTTRYRLFTNYETARDEFHRAQILREPPERIEELNRVLNAALDRHFWFEIGMAESFVLGARLAVKHVPHAIRTVLDEATGLDEIRDRLRDVEEVAAEVS